MLCDCRRFAGLAALALVLSVGAEARAGRLSDAGKATRSSSGGSSSSSSSRGNSSSSSGHHEHHGHHGDHCDSDGDGDAALALYILTLPWTGPNAVLEPVPRGSPAFEPYPYASGNNGLLRYPSSDVAMRDDDGSARDESPSTRTAPGREIAGQLRLDGGYIQGGVYRGGVSGRVLFPYRLELDATVHGLIEPLPDATVDRSTLANAHGAVRFAQNEHVQFRTGFGYQQYADAEGVEPGIDFAYGLQAAIGAHLILDLNGNLGSAGHAFVWQARATLGAMIGRFEIFGGYDHIQIRDVALGGPAVGIRAWL